MSSEILEGAVQSLASGIKASEEDATKHDQEKVRLELLPQEALEEVAKVLTHGAEKYGEHNWRKGMHWTRFVGAALRHLYAWQSGMEDRDPESGLSHLAHAACCILFLLVYEKLGIGEDDRWRR